MVSIKTYSTSSGESIASETVSESSSGKNLNACGGNLAKKLAAICGPLLGARVNDYWKRRSTYGREYVLTLNGGNLPLMVRAAFDKAVKGLAGVENATQASATNKQVKMTVAYKGTEPIDQALVFDAQPLVRHRAPRRGCACCPCPSTRS